MSQQKKQKVNITNRKLLNRLLRLAIVKALPVEKVIAYIGLLLVNKGNIITVPRALRIIEHSKLDLKIKVNSAIPCDNILDALIHLVVYKRKLLRFFFTNQNLPVWNYEHSGPLFDTMYDISKIYKI